LLQQVLAPRLAVPRAHSLITVVQSGEPKSPKPKANRNVQMRLLRTERERRQNFRFFSFHFPFSNGAYFDRKEKQKNREWRRLGNLLYAALRVDGAILRVEGYGIMPTSLMTILTMFMSTQTCRGQRFPFLLPRQRAPFGGPCSRSLH
jgi:hypothetical protein